MCLRRLRYRRFAEALILLSLLIVNGTLFAQNSTRQRDTINSHRETLNKLSPILLNDYHFASPDLMVPVNSGSYENNNGFLDSLRNRASKKLVTRKLYDFLVVTGNKAPKKAISGSSEKDFVAFSGMKIRNIEVQQLSVFGSGINNPLSYNPGKIEKALNKTHINTNEAIIRKNLLFSKNDTISPLSLSDNERILRQLPFIDDSRIIVIPVSEEEVDLVIITKDVYSLGASFDYRSINKWNGSLFDKNIFGMGHEFRLEVPNDAEKPNSPGFGVKYNINNISRSFINMALFYADGLGDKTYGLRLDRRFVSSETKYAGGISIQRMYTTEDLDSLTIPEPFKYNLQDYWLGRSFLLNRESVSRIFLGIRYTNNNVFDRPFILPDSYYYLQKYRIFLGSVAFSRQKYYKTNLIYSYGRTEDLPYGGLVSLTAGIEKNEFKERYYSGISVSAGGTLKNLGYFYSSAGAATFLTSKRTEQGVMLLRTVWFSNLFYLGSSRVRNFVKVDYTRGFGRYSDEYLVFDRTDGFAGFRSDSARGEQRLSLSLESVVFKPGNSYGFRFAFFGFAEIGFLFGTNEFARDGEALSSIGLGLRIRNDNLVFNTLQIRLGYFPNLPPYSKTNYFLLSGEKLLKPDNFDPGAPSLLPYR